LRWWWWNSGVANGLVDVRCVCALELRSGTEHRIWCDQSISCPYPVDSDSVLIAHYASAELLTHTSLRWQLPENVIDTCVEFSAMTAGMRRKDQGRSLLGALAYFGLDHIEATEKDEMRELALAEKQTADYTEAERAALLDYCMSDVRSLERLLPRLEGFLCFR
jgi:DNA polymerase I